MTRTVIDIDDGALKDAAQALGTKTKVETVNRALAEVAARSKRLEFLDRMLTTDDDLGDAETMDTAWR